MTSYLHAFTTVLIPAESPVPTQNPKVLRPYFDPDMLKKLDATLVKIQAYLEKTNVADWWEQWIEDARTQSTPAEPSDLEG